MSVAKTDLQITSKVASKVASKIALKVASKTFSFRGAFAELAKLELAKYPEERKQSAVLALLDLAQRQNSETNCVTDSAMDMIATMLGMPRMRLEEVASFYTMIRRVPTGKYHVQCCMTTPCWLRGGDDVKQRIERVLGIGNNETSADGMFTLSEVECLGACANSPVVQINDDLYEDLTVDDVATIFSQLKKGRLPKSGSQRSRRGAEPTDSEAMAVAKARASAEDV